MQYKLEEKPNLKYRENLSEKNSSWVELILIINLSCFITII